MVSCSVWGQMYHLKESAHCQYLTTNRSSLKQDNIIDIYIYAVLYQVRDGLDTLYVVYNHNLYVYNLVLWFVII